MEGEDTTKLRQAQKVGFSSLVQGTDPETLGNLQSATAGLGQGARWREGRWSLKGL